LSFISGFNSSVTKRAIAFDETIAGSIWQRNYYEHIIRDEQEWARIRAYIGTNPANWARDEENPER
jgi:putative transposase